MVSCFLTPSTQSQYTFPPALRNEVEDVVGEYLFDCTEFRTEDKDDLLRQIYEMTDKRFKLADHFLSTKPWELFAMVEMGTDRIHHGFWKDMDPAHRKHVPGGAYEQRDPRLPRPRRRPARRTCCATPTTRPPCWSSPTTAPSAWTAASASTSGCARRACWASQREPEGRSSTRDCGIDWSRTKVWAEGGYYSRVFLNVEGREPEGTIPAADYERFRDELIERISAIPDDQGSPIPTKVFRPEDVYPEIKGVAPDLIVHFGDLYWRAVGTVGGDEGLYTFDNDTGPDDANHAQHGMFILRAPGVEPGLREGAHLLDVAPTVLELLGQPVPPAMRGASLLERVTA